MKKRYRGLIRSAALLLSAAVTLLLAGCAPQPEQTADLPAATTTAPAQVQTISGTLPSPDGGEEQVSFTARFVGNDEKTDCRIYEDERGTQYRCVEDSDYPVCVQYAEEPVDGAAACTAEEAQETAVLYLTRLIDGEKGNFILESLSENRESAVYELEYRTIYHQLSAGTTVKVQVGSDGSVRSFSGLEYHTEYPSRILAVLQDPVRRAKLPTAREVEERMIRDCFYNQEDMILYCIHYGDRIGIFLYTGEGEDGQFTNVKGYSVFSLCHFEYLDITCESRGVHEYLYPHHVEYTYPITF